MNQSIRIQKFLDFVKSIAFSIWSAPPIELLLAALVVPSTIAFCCWIFQWVAPLLVLLGCLAGVIYFATAIVKIVYLFHQKRRK